MRKGNSVQAQVQMVVEVLKIVRNRWMSRREIAEELDMHAKTVAMWVEELAANGVLVELDTGSTKKNAERFFRLHHHWGGQPIAAAPVAGLALESGEFIPAAQLAASASAFQGGAS